MATHHVTFQGTALVWTTVPVEAKDAEEAKRLATEELYARAERGVGWWTRGEPDLSRASIIDVNLK